MSTGVSDGPRVLLVAHHFPPDFTIGSLRPRRVAIHLAANGWAVDVLSVRPAHLDAVDPAMCRGLEDVRVVRTHSLGLRAWMGDRLGTGGAAPAADPSAAPASRTGSGGLRATARRLGSRLASHVEIPDRWAGWIPFAVASGARLPRPAVILATAPAFSNLVVGRILAARFRAPLVLDYRDPWNPLARRTDLPPSRLRMEAALERWCLRRGARVVTTTPGIAEELRDLGVEAEVVTNACEPERFEGVAPRRFDRPTLVYAGGLYGDRTLDPVLDALVRLRDAGRIGPERLRVLYMGRTPEQAERSVASRALGDFVEIEGVRPSREALAATLGASCNLSLVGAEHARQIPAKVFEHIAARRPMLCVAPAGSDTESLLSDIPWARCVAPDAADALKEALLAVAEGSPTAGEIPIPTQLTVESTMGELERILRAARRGRDPSG